MKRMIRILGRAIKRSPLLFKTIVPTESIPELDKGNTDAKLDAVETLGSHDIRTSLVA